MQVVGWTNGLKRLVKWIIEHFKALLSTSVIPTPLVDFIKNINKAKILNNAIRSHDFINYSCTRIKPICNIALLNIITSSLPSLPPDLICSNPSCVLHQSLLDQFCSGLHFSMCYSISPTSQFQELCYSRVEWGGKIPEISGQFLAQSLAWGWLSLC